jgi:antitoxin component YwqK of YwqJK toxin-antitoxin module
MRKIIIISILFSCFKSLAQDSAFVMNLVNLHAQHDNQEYARIDSSYFTTSDSTKKLNWVRYYDSNNIVRKAFNFRIDQSLNYITIINSKKTPIFSTGLWANKKMKSLSIYDGTNKNICIILNWYENGTLKSQCKSVNSCLIGLFQEWWPNGNLKVQFNNEIEYAPFTYYYDDGKVWMKGTAFYGKTFVGDFIEYSKTSEILKQGKYRKNENDNRCEDNTEKVGVWSYYNNKTNTYIEIDETKLREDKAREDKLKYNKRKALKEKEEREKIKKINGKNLEKNPKAPIIFYVE